LVSHLRAARVIANSWTLRADSVPQRSQMGTGAPVDDSGRDVGGIVVKLARYAERGDTPPLPLLLESIAKVRELDFAASGGDCLLWMVPPVLRAAQWRLEEAAEERQALEAEVQALHTRAETASMDVEADRDWLIRADARARQRLRERRAATEQLRVDAVKMEKQLAHVQADSAALRQEADEGLSTERERAAQERLRLEEQIGELDVRIEELNQKLDLEEQFEKAQKELAQATETLDRFSPICMRQEEVARRADDRESQNQVLLEEITALEEEIAQKKNKKTGKGKKK